MSWGRELVILCRAATVEVVLVVYEVGTGTGSTDKEMKRRKQARRGTVG